MQVVKKYLILNIKSLVLLIVFIELSTIVAIGLNIYKKRISRNVLGASSYSVLSKNDIIASPSANLKYYYEYQPDIVSQDTSEWLYGKVSYTINKDTFNDLNNYSVEKPSDVFRIITLGDSFTFGQGVNTRDNWTERLENELNNKTQCNSNKKFEVINLGMPGYGVDYISNRYKLRGEKYNPDIIIWLESGADFDRVYELLGSYIKKYSESMTEQEKVTEQNKGNYYPVWQKANEDLYKNYSYSDLSKMVGEFWKNFLSDRGDKPVLISTFSDISDDKKTQLKEWIDDQKGISFYDSIPLVDSSKLKLKDGHPNVKGHQIIADSLFEYIKNNLISCN